jgi:hypothetical protein
VDADRNLLFGVLALQADLLTPARSAEACSAWAACKDAPLADLLVERGWLTPSDRADVEKLLLRKLAKHGGDARASLAEITTDPGIRLSLAGLVTPPQGLALVSTTADASRLAASRSDLPAREPDEQLSGRVVSPGPQPAHAVGGRCVVRHPPPAAKKSWPDSTAARINLVGSGPPPAGEFATRLSGPGSPGVAFA